tara:strand:- start:18641 stop:18817 length:177 start_codon:yes stop_codon:yes gene_type:complete
MRLEYHEIEELRKFLFNYLNSDLSPEEVVSLYCQINDKWGTVEYKSDKPIAVIGESYR